MKHDMNLTGAQLIAAERQRQIDQEGWTPEHDDEHEDESLALAAICYASPVPLYMCDIDSRATVRFVDPWPDSWDTRWDKRSEYGNADETEGGIADPETYTPEQRLDLLVKAGALIAAEIDRQKRALGVMEAPAPQVVQEQNESAGGAGGAVKNARDAAILAVASSVGMPASVGADTLILFALALRASDRTAGVPAFDDAQRLDWLQGFADVSLEAWFTGAAIERRVTRHGHTIGSGRTLREAIDAARTACPRGPADFPGSAAPGVQGMEAAPAGKRWQCVRCGEVHAQRHHSGECPTPNCHSVNLKLVCGNCLDTGYRDEGGQQVPCDACGVDLPDGAKNG